MKMTDERKEGREQSREGGKKGEREGGKEREMGENQGLASLKSTWWADGLKTRTEAEADIQLHGFFPSQNKNFSSALNLSTDCMTRPQIMKDNLLSLKSSDGPVTSTEYIQINTQISV